MTGNNALPNQVFTALKGQGITTSSRIIIAYSGGMDSHALLHIIAHSDFKNNLTAVHINHGLMPQANQWTDHCRQICGSLGVKFSCESVTVSRVHAQGLEAAAREARYVALSKYLQPDSVLLTAHHQDDQAETMLLQLLRGAGVPGLAAMPKATEFAMGKLIRPFLDIPRKDIKSYAQRLRLEWIEDQSNLDEQFSRNFLRKNVLPVLKQRWPEMNRQLARSASHLAESSNLLKRLAIQDLQTCKTADQQGLNLDELLKLDTESLKNALRYYIQSQDQLVPSNRQMTYIIRQIKHKSITRQQQIPWPGGVLRVYRRNLSVGRPQPALDLSARVQWDGDFGYSGEKTGVDEKLLKLPGSGYVLSAMTAVGSGLSVNKMQHGPVTLRFRQGGESCLLPGRGHHHKLKKLFQEAGIPPWERTRLPLVYVGEELAAVADKWVCAPFEARDGEAGLKLKLIPVPE